MFQVDSWGFASQQGRCTYIMDGCSLFFLITQQNPLVQAVVYEASQILQIAATEAHCENMCTVKLPAEGRLMLSAMSQHCRQCLKHIAELCCPCSTCFLKEIAAVLSVTCRHCWQCCNYIPSAVVTHQASNRL